MSDDYTDHAQRMTRALSVSMRDTAEVATAKAINDLLNDLFPRTVFVTRKTGTYRLSVNAADGSRQWAIRVVRGKAVVFRTIPECMVPNNVRLEARLELGE